jgi:hypothetical protein
MNIRKRTLAGIRAVVVLTVILGIANIGMAQQPGAPAGNPAYLNIDQAFDLSKIQPTVNVNIPKFLLDNILSQLDGGPDDPFAGIGINIADLTQGIQHIRVVVFEVKDPEKQKIVNSGIDKLKKSMSSKWMPIVNVPDGNVTVFAMGDETGKRLAGLAMMVAEKDSAVVGNIVGEVQIGKIIAAAGKMAGAGEGGQKAKEALQQLLQGMQPPPTPSESETPAPAEQ